MTTTTNPKTETSNDTMVARLPYLPLWAAAQFASTDEAKLLLQTINIRRDPESGHATIESTDGHRLFRYRFPLSADLTCLRFDHSILTGDSLQISAKPFRKFINYAHHVEVRFDLLCNVTGGKVKRTAAKTDPLPCELLQAFPATMSGLHFAGKDNGTFPNCDQLFPVDFNNEIKAPWAFNAKYLIDFMNVVKRASCNDVVRFRGNSPMTPFVMDCGLDIGHPLEQFSESDRRRFECLIMPVQIRV